MARDKIHFIVRRALEKDGWKITEDPLILLPEEDNISIDLGAEKLIIAEKGLEKIAVEVKSFEQPSLIYEFHRAVGTYIDYESALILSREERELFVAIPNTIYPKISNSRLMQTSLERIKMKILVVDIEKEIIVKWIK